MNEFQFDQDNLLAIATEVLKRVDQGPMSKFVSELTRAYLHEKNRVEFLSGHVVVVSKPVEWGNRVIIRYDPGEGVYFREAVDRARNLPLIPTTGS